MKVLLVCASGMSTSIVMKKMRQYASAKGIEGFEVSATGVGEFRNVADKYDVILLGPQIAYKKDDIVAGVNGQKPVDVIAPADYAIANCGNIFKQVNTLLGA